MQTSEKKQTVGFFLRTAALIQSKSPVGFLKRAHDPNDAHIVKKAFATSEMLGFIAKSAFNCGRKSELWMSNQNKYDRECKDLTASFNNAELDILKNKRVNHL